MKPLSTQEAKNKIIGQIRQGSLNDLERDNLGQLIVYTGLFMHQDGNIYTEPEELSEPKE